MDGRETKDPRVVPRSGTTRGSESNGQPRRGKVLSLSRLPLRHPEGDEESKRKGLEPFRGGAGRETRIRGPSALGSFVTRPASTTDLSLYYIEIIRILVFCSRLRREQKHCILISLYNIEINVL